MEKCEVQLWADDISAKEPFELKADFLTNLFTILTSSCGAI